MVRREDGEPKKQLTDFDIAYPVEEFLDDMAKVAAIAEVVESGKAGPQVMKQLEEYRREFGADATIRNFVGVRYMRSKYGTGGFRRYVRFEVVNDTLAAYRSEMDRRGLLSSAPASDSSLVKARIPVSIIERLLQAPILETPEGMTIGRDAVFAIFRGAAADIDGDAAGAND